MVFGLALVCCFSPALKASECPDLPPNTASQIETYLGQRLVSGANVKVSILSMDRLPNNCYWKVWIRISNSASPVAFYLSQDGRYLTSVVYDLLTDPQEEVSSIASNVQALLLRNESPRLSGVRTRLTVVEFGDLQCPYCKRFAEWYKSLPNSLRDQTTLVFKHLPLEQHSWAREAAVFAACANLQSTVGFWQLSDFLLLNQRDITTENLENKVVSTFTPEAGINVQRLKTCVNDGSGAAIVQRDIAVAKQLNVRSTPTIFVDGRRVLPLNSQEELNQLIERELHGSNSLLQTSGKHW